jgi:hypothetical protein
LVATAVYRGGIAVLDAPEGFASFRAGDGVRTPAEILAHVRDLLEGSLHLLRGELVYLTSSPLPWAEEVSRFFSAAQELDTYLESGMPLACSVEKLIQGPGDALTHIGQLVMLRRLDGGRSGRRAISQPK